MKCGLVGGGHHGFKSNFFDVETAVTAAMTVTSISATTRDVNWSSKFRISEKPFSDLNFGRSASLFLDSFCTGHFDIMHGFQNSDFDSVCEYLTQESEIRIELRRMMRKIAKTKPNSHFTLYS